MNKEELYEKLDIDEPEDFQYFENYAGLIELDEELKGDDLYSLLLDIDLKVFQELTESYFLDLLDNLPKEEVKLYNQLELVRNSLVGLAGEGKEKDENIILKLSDELARFQNWFSIEKRAKVFDNSSKTEKLLSLRDALGEMRGQKYSGKDLDVDLEFYEEYPMEEYIMTFGDLVN